MALLWAVLGAIVLLLALVWDERRAGWSLPFFLLAAVWQALSGGQFLGSPFEVAMLLAIGLVGIARGYAARPRWRNWVRYVYATALFMALLSLRYHGASSGSLPWSLVVFHAGVLLLSYLSLTVAFLAAESKWAQDRRLKKAPWKALDSVPLVTLSRLEDPYLRVGYALYTLGLLSGLAWAWRLWGSPLSWDVKEVAALLSWLLFTLVLLDRGRGGSSGARIALWRAAYLTMVFAFFIAPFWGGRHPV